MNFDPTIRLITQGGTIDKVYDPLTGEVGFTLTEPGGEVVRSMGGAAIKQIPQLAPRSVYVCMNGILRPWNNVYKDRTVGEFKVLPNPTAMK